MSETSGSPYYIAEEDVQTMVRLIKATPPLPLPSDRFVDCKLPQHEAQVLFKYWCECVDNMAWKDSNSCLHQLLEADIFLGFDLLGLTALHEALCQLVLSSNNKAKDAIRKNPCSAYPYITLAYNSASNGYPRMALRWLSLAKQASLPVESHAKFLDWFYQHLVWTVSAQDSLINEALKQLPNDLISRHEFFMDIDWNKNGLTNLANFTTLQFESNTEVRKAITRVIQNRTILKCNQVGVSFCRTINSSVDSHSWSEMPTQILRNICLHLNYTEFKSFRRTCKGIYTETNFSEVWDSVADRTAGKSLPRSKTMSYGLALLQHIGLFKQASILIHRRLTWDEDLSVARSLMLKSPSFLSIDPLSLDPFASFLSYTLSLLIMDPSGAAARLFVKEVPHLASMLMILLTRTRPPNDQSLLTTEVLELMVHFILTVGVTFLNELIAMGLLPTLRCIQWITEENPQLARTVLSLATCYHDLLQYQPVLATLYGQSHCFKDLSSEAMRRERKDILSGVFYFAMTYGSWNGFGEPAYDGFGDKGWRYHDPRVIKASHGAQYGVLAFSAAPEDSRQSIKGEGVLQMQGKCRLIPTIAGSPFTFILATGMDDEGENVDVLALGSSTSCAGLGGYCISMTRSRRSIEASISGTLTAENCRHILQLEADALRGTLSSWCLLRDARQPTPELLADLYDQVRDSHPQGRSVPPLTYQAEKFYVQSLRGLARGAFLMSRSSLPPADLKGILTAYQEDPKFYPEVCSKEGAFVEGLVKRLRMAGWEESLEHLEYRISALAITVGKLNRVRMASVRDMWDEQAAADLIFLLSHDKGPEVDVLLHKWFERLEWSPQEWYAYPASKDALIKLFKEALMSRELPLPIHRLPNGEPTMITKDGQLQKYSRWEAEDKAKRALEAEKTRAASYSTMKTLAVASAVGLVAVVSWTLLRWWKAKASSKQQ